MKLVASCIFLACAVFGTIVTIHAQAPPQALAAAPQNIDRRFLEAAERRDKAKVELHIKGEFLRAFLVAFESLKAKPPMPNQTLAIDDYDVYFLDENEFYGVLFMVRSRKYADRGGGGSELGRDIEYFVKKSDFTIARTMLFQ